VAKRKNIKICLGLLGIALTIIGWLLGSLSHIPSARNLILAKYKRALFTSEKMNKEGIVLNSGDIGFRGILGTPRKKWV